MARPPDGGYLALSEDDFITVVIGEQWPVSHHGRLPRRERRLRVREERSLKLSTNGFGFGLPQPTPGVGKPSQVSVSNGFGRDTRGGPTVVVLKDVLELRRGRRTGHADVEQLERADDVVSSAADLRPVPAEDSERGVARSRAKLHEDDSTTSER